MDCRLSKGMHRTDAFFVKHIRMTFSLPITIFSPRNFEATLHEVEIIVISN